jgi:hypothetical protein
LTASGTMQLPAGRSKRKATSQTRLSIVASPFVKETGMIARYSSVSRWNDMPLAVKEATWRGVACSPG